jgi:menaquinone-dependent protoporphyrinogen IX oxidase
MPSFPYLYSKVGGTSVKRRKAPAFKRRVLKMKGIVVYDTSYGNTKKIAETIAGTLKESGIEVDLFAVKDVKKLSVKDYNFLVLGSPTRFGTMSFAIRGFWAK